MGKIIFENEEIENLEKAIDEYIIQKTEKKSRENQYIEKFNGKTGKQQERTYYLGEDSIAILALLKDISKIENKNKKDCEVIILDGDYGTGKTNLLDIYESISTHEGGTSKLLIEKLEIFQSGYEENLLHYITTGFEDIQKRSEGEESDSKRKGILKRGIRWLILIAAIPICWDVLKFLFERNSIDIQNKQIINFFKIGNIHYYTRDVLWIIFFISIIAFIIFMIFEKIKEYKSDMMIYKKDYQEYFFEEAILLSVNQIREIKEKDDIIIAFEDIDRIYKEENIIEILRIIFKLKQKINEEKNWDKKVIFFLTLSLENLRERFYEKKVIEPSIMKLNPLQILPLKPRSLEYEEMITNEYFLALMLPDDKEYLSEFLNVCSHLINWRMLWRMEQTKNFYHECLKLILSSEYVQFKDEDEYIEVIPQNMPEDVKNLFEVISGLDNFTNSLFVYETLEVTWKPREMNNSQIEGKWMVRTRKSTIDQLSQDIKRLDDKSEIAKRLYSVFKLYFRKKRDNKVGYEFLELLIENAEVRNFLTLIKEEQEQKFGVESDEDVDISREMVTYLNEVTKVRNLVTGELTDNFFSPTEIEEFRKLLEQYIIINDAEDSSLLLQERSFLTTITTTNAPTRTKKVEDDYGVDEGIDFDTVIVPKPIISTLGQVENKTSEEQKDELLTFYDGGGKVDE